MPDGQKVGEQAVAMRISGDKAAFHNCKFIGFQDTLCDDKGMHFFKDCYIQGTVDFIFGNGKSLYLVVFFFHFFSFLIKTIVLKSSTPQYIYIIIILFYVQNTTIQSVAKNVGVITAQAREIVGDDSGFTFLYCNLTGAGNSTTYLGRAWKIRPRVIFAFTYMGTIIHSEGWSNNNHPERSQ